MLSVSRALLIEVMAGISRQSMDRSLGLDELVHLVKLEMLSWVTVDASILKWRVAHVFVFVFIHRLRVSIVSLATI